MDVNVDLDGDLAAPIAGAVAANANVAAPINAGVAANIDSDGSTAVAVAEQDAIIDQSITGDGATATADQDSSISQGRRDGRLGSVDHHQRYYQRRHDSGGYRRSQVLTATVLIRV